MELLFAGRAAQKLEGWCMKKTCAALVLSVLLVGSAVAESSIKLGDEMFVLAYKEDVKDGSLKEFVRPNETIENWTTLIAVRTFNKVKSPKKYIESMAADYHAKYPLNQFGVFQRKETDSWVIDFILFPSSDKRGEVIEWNVFIAEKNPTGKGIRVNQFAARRVITESMKETFESWDLRSYRTRMLKILMGSSFKITEG